MSNNIKGNATFFRMLGSLLYNEPDENMMEALIGSNIFSEIPYAEDEPLVTQGAEQVASWLRTDNINNLTAAAKSDYTNLFIGIGAVLAPPWGSYYLSEERLLYQKGTLMVRELYRRCGLGRRKKRGSNEPDDHIGLELEFLAYLLENGYKHYTADFVDMCVLGWIYLWANDVLENAKTGLYSGLAKMAAGSIKYFTMNVH